MEKNESSQSKKYQETSQKKRAWELTRAITGFNLWTGLYGLLVLMFYVLLFFLLRGWSALVQELPLLLLQGIAAVVLAFVTLYLINLVRVPYVVNQERLAVIRELENELSPERISARITTATYTYTDEFGHQFAALRLTNNNSQTVFLKGLPRAIFHDSDGFDENLLNSLNRYESKLQWKGGSEEGTKMIEHEAQKSLDIAYAHDEGLKLIFRADWAKVEPKGIYKIQLTVMGNMGKRLIEAIQFTGRLEYAGGDKLAFREWSEEETAQE